MYWNYRVVRKKELTCTTFAIHEVYYDDNGHPTAVTENPIPIIGDSFEELSSDAAFHTEALILPVLDYDDIPDMP